MHDYIQQSKSRTYTVESFLGRMALKGQRQIWEKFPENVFVKGRVVRVNPYKKKYVYITLEGSGYQLTLKSDFETRPNVGEYIIFSGHAVLKPHAFNMSGLNVEVIGESVGHWKPVEEAAENKSLNNNVPLIKKGTTVLLSQYLKNSDSTNLLVLGSETGLRDVGSCCGSEIPIEMEQVRVRDTEVFSEDLRSAIDRRKPSAIAIVRGGDDETLRIWDEPELVGKLLDLNIPFYLAIGHSHLSTLADKYADESFHTPSSFGLALSSHVKEIAERDSMRHEIELLKFELKNNNNQINELNSKYHKAKNSLSNRTNILVAVSLFLAGCLYYLYQ